MICHETVLQSSSTALQHGRLSTKTAKVSGTFYFWQLQSCTRCLPPLPSAAWFFQNCRSSYSITLHMFSVLDFWVFFGVFFLVGFFFIEGHNTGIYINAFKNTCPVKLQSNNSLKTKICFWQLKFSRFGQGGLLHWEQYILKKKLLKDVASPFIPSLWKLLNSKAKHFLSKLLKL